MVGTSAPSEGLRERKRRETARRITEAGIALFIEKGYDATTIDEIAAAAGISRRTFFYYHATKDDILLSLQSGVGDKIIDALLAQPGDLKPMAAARAAVTAICADQPVDQALAIDRLMRGSASVLAHKQANYVRHEQALFAALQQKWPDPLRETGLRLVAMATIGAMRLVFDTLNREQGLRPIRVLLDEAFDALSAEI